MYRPTYIEVDCNKLENNIKKIVKKYSDYKYFFGVAKNNAYHHGIYCVNHLINAGINYLCVSSLEEAEQVRRYNSDIPILCLEPIKTEYVYDAINNNVTISITSFHEAQELNDLKLSDQVKVHLKIDSGMNRLGIKRSEELIKIYNLLKSNQKIFVEGIYTHLAFDGLSDINYEKQVDCFRQIVSSIDLKEIPVVHIDRSYTAFLHKKIDIVNGVRLGLGIYGFKPEPQKRGLLSLFSHAKGKDLFLDSELVNTDYVFSCYTEVISVREVFAGDFVGYNATFKVKDHGYIATIPCGYADGITKDFEYVYIKNRRYKIVAECMDMLMILVDDTIKVGNKVEIVGKNQNPSIIAKRMGIIDHKFLNLFTNRVPIIYTYSGNNFEVKY